MKDFSFPNPRPVEPSPETGDGAQAAGAAPRQEGAKDEAAKEAEPARDAPRRAGKKAAPTRQPDPLTGAAAYYRSVRMLSIAFVIVSVSATLGAVALALIFTTAQERQLSISQQHVKEAVAAATAAQATQASVREAQLLEKLVMPIAEMKEQQAKLAQSFAAQEDGLRKVNARLDEERRIETLPVNLSRSQQSAAARTLAVVLPKIRDREAKRAAEELHHSLRNNATRPEIYQGYRRLRDKLPAGEARTVVENELKKPIMAE